jgi:hypothetical protein
VDLSTSLSYATNNMPDPDDHMDSTGAGSQPHLPHCSPCNHEHSTSPRAHDRTLWRQESLQWGYNPVTDFIVHCGAQCPICSKYIMHVNNTLVDDDQSYIDAQDCRQVMFIPHHQWLDECTALARANEQLDRAENQQPKDQEEISHLQLCIAALEDKLSLVKANLFASITEKAMDRPLMGMPNLPT